MGKLRYSSLVFVSSSLKKLTEYRALLSLPDLKMAEVQIVDPQDLNIETLVRKKVEDVRKIIGDAPFFVEHTGLIIDAWKGLPGGLTRQFIDTVGVLGICKMLQVYEGNDRIARVKTTIGYFYDNSLHTFEGTAIGTIALKPRLRPGFNWDWDSIFIPEGYTLTYAEMQPQDKNKISMRMKAALKFKEEYLSLHYEHNKDESTEQTQNGKYGWPEENPISLVKIIFLAAEPTDTSRLRLGEELREIQEKLQLAKLRERFELHQRMSIRSSDISQALLDVQPRIVHFSGHGMAKGELCFENQKGETHPIESDALAALFEQFNDQISCVVLNACYSETQANAIAKHIAYVIGTNKAIGDKAAIAFAIGFYQALGAGRTIEEAYKLGCVQIRLQGIPEYLTPVLIKKEKAKP